MFENHRTPQVAGRLEKCPAVVLWCHAVFLLTNKQRFLANLRQLNCKLYCNWYKSK